MRGAPAVAGPRPAAEGETAGTPGGVRPAATAAGPRRLLALGAGLAALLLVAVLLWPIGVLTGDDEPASGSQAEEGGGQAAGEGRQATSGQAAGIGIVAVQRRQRTVLVRASNLEVSGQRRAYQVWLYNSPQDAKAVAAQFTDDQGQYQAIGLWPKDFAKYRFIDVSLEPVDENPAIRGPRSFAARSPSCATPTRRATRPRCSARRC